MEPEPSIGIRLRNWKQQGTKVQSVICAKARFKTAGAARSWCKAHGFTTSKIDETATSYRFRQFDPNECARNSFVSHRLTDGVTAVLCRRRTKAMGRRGGEDDDGAKDRRPRVT
jgi:hypothetical protein